VLAATQKSSFNAQLNCTRGDYAYQDFCQLVCKRGFEFRNPAAGTNLSCELPLGQEDDTDAVVSWKGGAGSGCKRLKCPGEIPRVTAVRHATIICPPRGDNIMRFDDACDVRCKDLNYKLTGIPTDDGNKGKLTCVMDDSDVLGLDGWPMCTPISCGTTKIMPDGRVVPRSEKLDEATTGPCEGLTSGEKCSVKCADGFEPLLDGVGDADGNIALTCREGVLWGPQYLKFTKVCKVKGDIVAVAPVVRSAVTLTGSVEGSGNFNSLRAWARDKQVQKVLRQVIASTASSEDILFVKADVELDDPQALRRLKALDELEQNNVVVHQSVKRRLAGRLSYEDMLEDEEGEGEDVFRLRGAEESQERQLSSQGTKVTFVILMQGENAKPENLDKALNAAKGQLAEAANDTSTFLDDLRMELFFNPDIYFPPGLDVMIAEPMISVQIVVEGTATTTPAPTEPPPDYSQRNLAIGLGVGIPVGLLCLFCGWRANKKAKRRAGGKGKPVAKKKAAVAPKPDSPREEKKGEPEKFVPKEITQKPSEVAGAKGLLDELMKENTAGLEEGKPSAGPEPAEEPSTTGEPQEGVYPQPQSPKGQ
jgi:hypothetical protein